MKAFSKFNLLVKKKKIYPLMVNKNFLWNWENGEFNDIVFGDKDPGCKIYWAI